MNLNHFVISGNVTRDLELRYLPSGTATVTFTVACNFVRYDENGAKHERTDFVPITTFGKQAERDTKYLHRASPVEVEGRIESWYQRDEKRGGFNFKATNVHYVARGPGEFVGARQSGELRSGMSEEPRGSDADGSDDAERDAWLREYDAAEKKNGAGRIAGH